MHKFAYLCFLLCACAANSTPTQESPEPSFERILTAEGISNGTVHCIIQDRYGFLWLGTTMGLLRYDGYMFKRYAHNPSDSNSLSGDLVWSVCEDSGGDLWLGTSGKGLDRYVRSEDRFVRYRYDPGDSTSLLGDEVVWVYVDRANDIWAASWNRGLNKFNKSANSFTRYTSDSLLPSNNVHRMYEDQSGRFWIGTRRGLAMFDRKAETSRMYKSNPGNPRTLPGEYMFAIYETRDSTVYLGTDAGICKYDPRTDGFIRIPIPQLHEPVSALCQDGVGRLWVATDGDGVFAIDLISGRQSRFEMNPNLAEAISSNVVLSFCHDRGGILWFGTAATGLSKWNPSKKKFPHCMTSPATVNTIFEDTDGTVWVGTQGGVNTIIPGTQIIDLMKNNPGFPQSLKEETVNAIVEDHQGVIWFGTTGEGVVGWDKKRQSVRRIGVPPGPKDKTNTFVTSLLVDSRGDLWIGQSGGGVSRYSIRERTFEDHSVGSHPPFPGNYIWALHEDRNGNIWCGTWGIGVVRYTPGTGEIVEFGKREQGGDTNAISGDVVVSIAEEANGVLWFGTWGDGLNRYDPATKSFTHYSVGDGLPNDQIYGILIDEKSGELWLTTSYGLARFDPRTGKSVNYEEQDGIQSLEFRRGAAHKGHSGNFYVGGVNGINIFRPDEISARASFSPIVLTSIKIYDTTVPPLTDRLDLSHDENFLSFEFATLDFSDPRKNLYRYRLEGLDEHWIMSGSRRYVSYANLPPGKYVFTVSGSNSDGVWNERGAALNIIIAPPPWKTWWAYTFYVAVALSAGFGWRRYENATIRRKEREESAIREAELRAEMAEKQKELEKQQTRVQIARDLHDEVGGTLSSIAFFAEAMEKRVDQDARNKFLSLIAEGSSRAKEAMSDIVWSIDPSNDSWESTVAKLQRYASDLFESRGIAHTISMPSTTEGIRIDPQRRRHLWLVFKEILTNAARHSRCTQVSVALTLLNARISLDVEDNGIGFAAGQTVPGHGIRNIYQRGEALGADVNLTTSAGGGTAWNIVFPMEMHDRN